MRFKALQVCIFLMILNTVIVIIDGFGVVPLGYSPQFTSESGGGTAFNVLHITGFVDSNGNLNKAAIIGTVVAVMGVLMAITTFLHSAIGAVVGIFSVVFWSTFLVSYLVIEQMLVAFGWEMLGLPIFLLVSVFFIMGAMQIATGSGFSAFE